MIGTSSEHHVLYQYSLVGASNHYIGTAQTETVRAIYPASYSFPNMSPFMKPYFQPSPSAPSPFTTDSTYNDPTFSSDQTMAWALYVENSSDILIFGAGFYSFFQVRSLRRLSLFLVGLD